MLFARESYCNRNRSHRAFQDAWNAAEISVDIELRRVATRRNPKGKVKEVIAFMLLPAPSRIAAKVEAIEMERKGSWQMPPKTTKAPVAAEERPVNVVAFRPDLPKFLNLNRFWTEPHTDPIMEAKKGETYEF